MLKNHLKNPCSECPPVSYFHRGWSPTQKSDPLFSASVIANTSAKFFMSCSGNTAVIELLHAFTHTHTLHITRSFQTSRPQLFVTHGQVKFEFHRASPRHLFTTLLVVCSSCRGNAMQSRENHSGLRCKIQKTVPILYASNPFKSISIQLLLLTVLLPGVHLGVSTAMAVPQSG